MSDALLKPMDATPTSNMATGQVAPVVPVVQPEPIKQEVKEIVIPKEDDRFSSKFAAIAKKEKEHRAKELELKSLQKKLEDEKRETAERLKKYETWETKRQRAKEDPFSYLDDAGLSYDDLTAYALSGKKPPVRDSRTDQVLSKVEELEKQLQESTKAAQTREEQAAVSHWKSEAKQVADTKPENYELIRSFNAYDVVYQVADEKYRSEGMTLTHEEALDIVEDYYAKELDALLAKASSLNKFKGKFNLAEAVKAETPKPTPAKEPNTLSNNITSTVSPSELSMDPYERMRQVKKMIT